jgi:hypothetical protein
MIGNDHPTNADFAAMMYNNGRQQPQGYMGVPQQYAPIMTQQPMYPAPVYKSNWYTNIASEIKTLCF